MRVGIFDSGIGGLSVLHHALRAIPDAEYVYYADEAHVPYGEKSAKQIKQYIEEIIRFMLEKQVDAIVIACNTATSVATREYRSRFPVPIIGMEPAVKPAAEAYADVPGRILVAATPVTIAGDKLHHLLEKVDEDHEVDLIALPQLVRFAENGEFESPEITEYLRKELRGYPVSTYKALVLGCTHFNYFKAHYRQVFPEHIHYVDGNAGTIRQLERKLKESGAGPSGNPGRTEYFFSGRPVNGQEKKRIQKYMHQLDRLDK